MIIGITGLAGSGKSLAAGELAANGFVRMAFASPVKALACMLLKSLGYSYKDASDAMIDKKHVVACLGITTRQLLQKIGTDFGRNALHKNLWLTCAQESVAKTHEKTDLIDFVFDDVRFNNEAQWIRSSNYGSPGLMIHIVRNGVVSDGHESEQGITLEKGDIIIDNNGSIADLRLKILQALEYFNTAGVN